MMEYFVFAIVGYILTTQAFLIGVKQGRKLDTKTPVKTIIDHLEDKIETIKPNKDKFQEEVDELMEYSYEKALQSVKEERLRGSK